MNGGYTPKQGDIVLIDPPPAAEGHEQAKDRPWLVVSSKPFHDKMGLMLVVPVTTAVKGNPFEVLIKGAKHVTGAALAHQVQCLDWQARRARQVDHADSQVVANVGGVLNVIMKVRAGG